MHTDVTSARGGEQEHNTDRVYGQKRGFEQTRTDRAAMTRGQTSPIMFSALKGAHKGLSARQAITYDGHCVQQTNCPHIMCSVGRCAVFHKSLRHAKCCHSALSMSPRAEAVWRLTDSLTARYRDGGSFMTATHRAGAAWQREEQRHKRKLDKQPSRCA